MVNKILAIGVSLLIGGLILYSNLPAEGKARSGLLDDHFARIADEVNSDPSSSWVANTEYVPFNRNDLSKKFNLIVEESLPDNFDEAPVLGNDPLPENFDPREKWPQCESFKDVRDQSACGSCWAFGAVSAMSDRLCVKSGQKDQRRISSEDLLECCDSCGFGCEGGYLYQSWSYSKSDGLVTGGLYDDKKFCKPYAFPPCNHHSKGPYDDCSQHDYETPECKRKCQDGYETEYKKDRIKSASIYSIRGEENIMRELFTNGSVEASFTVYEDFLLYKSGVYQRRSGSALGGHAIKIMGYGVENGLKYWLGVNSWNTNWGENGTFKILRGKDECKIEANIVSGTY